MLQKERITMKSIVVLGNGFLGETFKAHNFNVLGKDQFYIEPKNLYKDVYDMPEIKQLYKYDIIINCIAKSNTRWCEKPENFEEALLINGILPQKLSDFCWSTNKKFVHISTGCLYDNYLIPQAETDFTVTHCNYTVTKRVGEMGCDPKYDLILRPRLFFGTTENRNNLLCKLPKFERLVGHIEDSLTSTSVLVEAICALLKGEATGIFNVACSGYVSMHDIAKLLNLDNAKNETLFPHELRQRENLYLVNNKMDITNLMMYYHPPKVTDEIVRCWNELHGMATERRT
jgi:dTDP-4-dehydrorhamnose reductase